MSLNQSNHTWF